MLNHFWAYLFWLLLTLLVILKTTAVGSTNSVPSGGVKCAYANCPDSKPHMLNVHVVAHTHNDVGWVKTFDQYYRNSVKGILSGVIENLLKDSKKRFIYAESAFFFKWWKGQSLKLQNQVKMLVNKGRLEFVGGAWSMNDEATTHYQSIIDQFAWGLRNLNDTFGKCGRPRVGWQIDPFGHSREMASIFAQMGFDGLFFGRLDYQDKHQRLMYRNSEMLWRASANLDEVDPLFTGALYNQYQPPPKFCSEIFCGENPKDMVDYFLYYAKNQAQFYRTNNIIVTLGDDFAYEDAYTALKSVDKLIRYVNGRQANGSDINIFYSTPSCYLKALHDAGITWPTKDDDFFPYASGPHSYWTGFYTSRPTIKRYERVGNQFLQICKQLTTLYPYRDPVMLPRLNSLREIMGVMQHHDAVSGTEQERVANDYARHLSLGMRNCQGNIRSILNFLAEGNKPRPKRYVAPKPFKLEFKTCSDRNISACDVSEQSEIFIATVYNPLGHVTSHYVRLPVIDVNYIVRDHEDVIMNIQYVPVPEALQKLAYRSSPAKYEVIFLATEIPAFGYKSFYIQQTKGRHMKPIPEPDNISSSTEIGYQNIKLSFGTNGFLSAVTADGIIRNVSQEFLYYESFQSDDIDGVQLSGAYIFRPLTDMVVRKVSVAPKITVYRGDLVDEVHQVFNDWISQVVRVYKQRRYAEFEWMVGPIPVDDGKGKEIITRFNSDIQSDGIFYTDSNGREMMKRLRNHRYTWNVKLQEKTAGNYYPITTKIALEDENARLAILTDRAQGGSSMRDGSLELMVHRRLLYDDNWGLDQALNDGLVARGTHYLILGSSQLDKSPTVQSLERFTQLETTLAPWIFLSGTHHDYDAWKQQFNHTFTGVSENLPKNIHLLTFEPWHEGEILVRFEHILERDEDPEYSKSVQINVRNVFQGFPIIDLRETTLDGSAWLDENHRMEFVADSVEQRSSSTPISTMEFQDELPENYWSEETKTYQGPTGEGRKPVQKRDDHKFVIELNAMQIRTFVLYLG